MSVAEKIVSCFRSQTQTSVTYFIGADFPAFNGHFENNPLLPAVVQIGLCAEALGRLHGKKYEIAKVSRAKFMRPILPDSEVTVQIFPRANGQFLGTLENPQTHEKVSQIIFSVKEL